MNPDLLLFRSLLEKKQIELMVMDLKQCEKCPNDELLAAISGLKMQIHNYEWVLKERDKLFDKVREMIKEMQAPTDAFINNLIKTIKEF